MSTATTKIEKRAASAKAPRVEANAVSTLRFTRVWYVAQAQGLPKLQLAWAGANITNETPFLVTLTGSGGPQPPQTGTGDSTTIQRDLSSGGPWTVTVTVNSSTSLSAQVITVAPILQSFEYDGGQITIKWNPNGLSAGMNIWLVARDRQDLAFNLGPSSPSSKDLSDMDDGFFDAATLSGAILQARSGVSRGPSSASFIPIVTPPINAYLGCQGTSSQLVGTWNAPPSVSPNSYDVVLKINGAPQSPVSQETPPYDSTLNLAPGIVYAMRVRSKTGQSSAAQIIGPYSQYVPGPYLAAVTYSFDAFGRLEQMTVNGSTTITESLDTYGNLQNESQSS